MVVRITLLWATLFVLLHLQTILVESRTTAASSFPGVRPSRPSRSYYSDSQQWWNDGGPGGASSDDEGEDEEEDESSDDEEWNRLSSAVAAAEDSASNNMNSRRGMNVRQSNQQDSTLLASTNGGGQGYGGQQTPAPPATNSATSVAQKSASSTDSSTSGQQAQNQQRSGENKSSSTGAETDTPSAAASASPMQTLNKLQQMLDDTDYITSNSERTTSPDNSNNINNNNQNEPQRRSEQQRQSQVSASEKLWTSKDRSKYKRVQNRVGERPQQAPPAPKRPPGMETGAQINEPVLPKQPPRPPDTGTVRPSPPLQFVSDDDNSEEMEERDYTLPNLPVYYSDGEESEDIIEEVKQQPKAPANAMVSGFQQPPVPPIQQGTPYGAFPPPPQAGQYYGYPQQPQQHQPPLQPQQMSPSPGQYGAPYPYSNYYQYPYHPQYMTPMQHAYYSQQYGPWNGYTQQQQPPRQPQLQLPPKPSLTPNPQQRQQQQLPPPKTAGSASVPNGSAPPPSPQSHGSPSTASSPATSDGTVAVEDPSRLYVPGYTPVTIFVPPENLVDQSQTINFDSFQKVGLIALTVTLGCYSGVSPRSLPLSEYNLRFYENLGLVALAMIAPVFQCLLVVAPSQNDVNAFINTFFTSFTVGFVWAFVSEIVATTAVRLLVFSWFEPSIFSLAPKVPIPIIPWVLRETRYRPKRITLLASEIAASLLVCPIIEEYIKLCILRWTTPLKRNFNWTKKQVVSKSSSGKKKKKMRNAWVTEPIIRPPNEPDIVNANQYVAQMLATSLGLKLADTGRRILLYTKQEHPSKKLYAFFRGLFPLQELTGTVTALQLAKRNLLGLEMPMWKLLLPAVVIHAMANFRGKKPVYRWGSATPWAEMQLPAFHVPDSSPLPKLLIKGFGKIMWFIIITRVIGYCVKNYYMVNRQAVKRTTTFAGRPASFSAKLTTSEALKKK